MQDTVVKTPGAIGISGAQESKVNLSVAQYLQTELIRQGVSVKISRTSDITKDLNDRSKEANQWGADVVVSIHCNAYNNANANGTETFVYKKGSNSEKIANQVQKNLIAALNTTNRGVKEGNLAIVRDTNAPAILVELAFITNKSDCVKLVDTTYQKECAVAICKGLCTYLGIPYKKEKINTVITTDYQGHWAEQAISKLIHTSVMVGSSEGKFRPNDTATRAEVAQTIYNLLKYLGK